MPSNLYETDFYAWTQEQSKLLKAGDFKHLDIVNLVEEIESLGKQQRQELRNRLGILIGHFLKWDYQPEKRSKSWRVTIRIQRREVEALLSDNPSLKSYLPEAIAKGYEAGLDLAVLETPLDYKDLPTDCTYTVDQIFDPEFPIGINEV
ncbi:DUF29 domain-containing protein [Leptolyngbya sp. NK1-12]|uniref:DUF29 domain-containing protein n=1 Tax=Leptolyngbya sp. NK1-12 TaxID=2547451 RepID=A0AA96WA73_9CYAN|nr:DUF29 domain-containing protein [Leptolyngbya sp. NK1-12]WNZ22642.1 DUF29 domain-containing protein [Leptolyngbya sp. NK1-12]